MLDLTGRWNLLIIGEYNRIDLIPLISLGLDCCGPFLAFKSLLLALINTISCRLRSAVAHLLRLLMCFQLFIIFKGLPAAHTLGRPSMFSVDVCSGELSTTTSNDEYVAYFRRWTESQPGPTQLRM
jgi:hypothetical protein